MKLQLEISNFCGFGKSEEVVNDFLSNVRSNYKPNGKVMIKHGFSIENIQPAYCRYSVFSFAKPRIFLTSTKYFVCGSFLITSTFETV